MKKMIRWWKLRRLRIAHEQYSVWKAKKEEWHRQFRDGDMFFKTNSWNRHRTIHAAGQEAKYLERVEHLIRNASEP